MAANKHGSSAAATISAAAVAGKKPSKAQNRAVEEALQERFGSHAGWAHNVLFISELAQMRHLLPEAARAQVLVAEATAEGFAGPAQSAEPQAELEALSTGSAGPAACSASAEVLVKVSCTVRTTLGGDLAADGAREESKLGSVEAGPRKAAACAFAAGEGVRGVRGWRRRRLQ